MEVDSVVAVAEGEICTQAQSGDGMRTWRLTLQTSAPDGRQESGSASGHYRHSGSEEVEQLSRSADRFRDYGGAAVQRCSGSSSPKGAQPSLRLRHEAQPGQAAAARRIPSSDFVM